MLEQGGTAGSAYRSLIPPSECRSEPMTRTHEIEHLEEDAQRTREKLTNTVDTLRGRLTNAVSPSVVTRDLQGYLVRKVKENPLQAAGLAAGLAFPLTRLLATMPA